MLSTTHVEIYIPLSALRKEHRGLNVVQRREHTNPRVTEESIESEQDSTSQGVRYRGRICPGRIA